MKGLHLRSLSGELTKVHWRQAEKPQRAIKDLETKLGPYKRRIEDECGGTFSIVEDYYQLPLRAFDVFSFDELCKLAHAPRCMMEKAVNTLFETSARHEVVFKIKNSMWRWGVGGTWNEVVDAYRHLRRFTFSNDPDFEVRLDHTTHYNEFGRGKYSRVYLDGVFAYLVYYKRKHVLTIGFTVMPDKKLLIQQVQSAQRSGNRCLYRLPSNRVEHALQLFRKNFPRYELLLIDGGSLAEKTLADYGRQLASAQKLCETYQALAAKSAGADRAFYQGCSQRSEQNRAHYEANITHLRADKERLAAMYANTGRFKLSSVPVIKYGMKHYPVLDSFTS